MDFVFVFIGFLLVILGVLGCVLPVLPGPQLVYISLVLLHFTSTHPFSRGFLIAWLVVNIIIQVIDYMIPIRGTQKMGGTKYGTRGSTIGLIVAILIFPLLGIVIGPFGLLGIIGCPFLGAYIGEKIGGREHTHALKSAFGSFIGFLSGTVLKLVISIIMAGYFFYHAYLLIISKF